MSFLTQQKKPSRGGLGMGCIGAYQIGEIAVQNRKVIASIDADGT